MWELDHKEGWALKNWCLRTVVLEKTLESPMDSRAINPVTPKENQPWIFIGRTDAEVEAPVLWPPDIKSQFIRKDPDAGKGWRQQKGKTEDKMVGWHDQLNGCEFEQAMGDGDGQGSLESQRVTKSQTWLNNKWPMRKTQTPQNLAIVQHHGKILSTEFKFTMQHRIC